MIQIFFLAMLAAIVTAIIGSTVSNRKSAREKLTSEEHEWSAALQCKNCGALQCKPMGYKEAPVVCAKCGCAPREGTGGYDEWTAVFRTVARMRRGKEWIVADVHAPQVGRRLA